MLVNKGEIWWAALDDPTGSEPGGRRPVLVLQANSFNQSKINTVIVTVITSNLNLARAPGNFLLKTTVSKLPKDSVVNVSQILTLNKSRLQSCVTKLSEPSLEKIVVGIKLVLDLQ